MSNHDKFKKKAAMKILTINVGQNIKDAIDLLVAFDFFPSRSEAIRHAIDYWLPTQMDMVRKISVFLEEMKSLDDIADKVFDKLNTRISRIEDKAIQKKVKKVVKGNINKLIKEEIINGVRIKEYQRVDFSEVGKNEGLSTYNDLPPEVQQVIDKINAGT